MTKTFVRNAADSQRPLHRVSDRSWSTVSIASLRIKKCRFGCCVVATLSVVIRGEMMLEQYKKTFVRMQALIAVVSMGVLVTTHAWPLATLFFATMQLGAIAGAMWGVRLKEKVRRGGLFAARGRIGG
jgi:hypothetical protein